VHAFDFLRLEPEAARRPYYALVGEEPFLREEALRRINRLHGGDEDLAFDRVEGDSAALADVLDGLREVPMFGSIRVVVVSGADDFVSGHRGELEKYTQHPSRTGVLVLEVKSFPGNTRLARQFAAGGVVVECKPPPAAGLATWLIGRAKRDLGAKLDPDAAQALVELVGAEVGVLASELDKLTTYVGEARHVRREDVVRMTAGAHLESIWKVLDAATTGQARDALRELDRLVTSGEHPVGLLAAMSASLRKVYRAGMLRLGRQDPRDACRAAGIPPFAVETTLRQHTHLGRDRVAALPSLLLRTDLDLKGGSQLGPKAVLERLIVELSRPRRD
jgi:DNA polymerase-3 subunit delta